MGEVAERVAVGVVIANLGSATAAPTNNPANGSFPLVSGADDNANTTEAEWTAALTSFSGHYGSGQVSAPGHTTEIGYVALNTHAIAFNRDRKSTRLNSS